MRKLSRDEWVDGAFKGLVDGGLDALRVEPLAKRLGVTKGSFYHHFENRRALHLELLAEWERLGTSQIIETVDASAANPAEQARMLAHRTLTPNPFSDAIENAIRAWAATDEVVADAVARVDETRVDYVVSLLRALGLPAPLARRRSKLFYRVIIGEYMWRQSGGQAMTKREIDEAYELLTQPA